MKPTKNPDGTERSRDEQRPEHGPQYHGQQWKAADDEERISTSDSDEQVADEAPDVESGGDRAGMGRGEKPRKDKQREP